MNKTITFVTAFYNISRQTSKEINKFENYFNWIDTLLSQNINIVFYVSQDIFNKLNYDKPNIKFIVNDEIPYKKDINWKKYLSNDFEKDSEKFAALTYSKFLWLKDAMSNNYFKTDYFSWIDAGICKVVQNVNMINTIIPRSKISIMLMNYINSNEMSSIDNFLSSCKYKVAAGFFVGPKELLNNFCDLVLDEIDKHSVNGLEQEYMAIVYYKNKHIFNPYWGDFSDLFVNYERCFNNKLIVERYIKNTIDYRDFAEYQKVLNYSKL